MVVLISLVLIQTMFTHAHAFLLKSFGLFVAAAAVVSNVFTSFIGIHIVHIEMPFHMANYSTVPNTLFIFNFSTTSSIFFCSSCD